MTSTAKKQHLSRIENRSFKRTSGFGTPII